ncbi:hypothetical protein ACFZA2_10335 [Microbacterium sp. NPDC007973]|uniref:hypothetical protein n=1 Tax=Microbacterium sp. NPDC007973 TaxID=3364182 RepID=UPI0036F1161B
MDDDTEIPAEAEETEEGVDGTDAPEPFEQDFPDIEPPSTEDPAIYRDGATS